jgi:hypothetical protein
MLYDPDDGDSTFLRNARKITTSYGVTPQKTVLFSPSIIYREEKEVLDVQEGEETPMPEEEDNLCHEENMWGCW